MSSPSTPGIESPRWTPVKGRPGWDALLGRACTALVVALLLIELVVRAVDWKAGRKAAFYLPPPTDNLIVEPHPFLSCALTPGWDRAGAYQIHINSQGMRGVEMSPRKAAGTYRILCSGGSTTFCTGATSDEKAWPAQLELALNQKPPAVLRYEVGNIGVSGWTTVENLIDLELRRVELAPDAFVFYGAANDARPIQAIRDSEFEPDYTNLRRVWSPEELSPFEIFLVGNVRTYAWLSRGTESERQLGNIATHLFVPGYEKLHVRSDERVNEAGVQVFLRNLRSMLAVCRVHRIQPVLCTFATCASKQKPGEERFLETVAAMNQGIEALAAEESVRLIDISRDLDDKPALYDDWMHHNDAGCRAFAECLARQAREQGLFGLQ